MTEMGEWIDLESLVSINRIAEMRDESSRDTLWILRRTPGVELLSLSEYGQMVGIRSDVYGLTGGFFSRADEGDEDVVYIYKTALAVLQQKMPYLFYPRASEFEIDSTQWGPITETPQTSGPESKEVRELREENEQLKKKVAELEKQLNLANGAKKARESKDLTTAETWAEYLKSAVYLACLWGKDGEKLSRVERNEILKGKEGFFQLIEDADKSFCFAMRDFCPGSVKGPKTNGPRLESQRPEVEQPTTQGSQSEPRGFNQ